jgi:hypothetical protein
MNPGFSFDRSADATSLKERPAIDGLYRRELLEPIRTGPRVDRVRATVLS